MGDELRADHALRRFLHELPDHLTPGGEAWLILSDLAERLGLRTRQESTGMFADAGLRVVDRLDTRPRHRTHQRADPLAEYRAAEITSLWRLARVTGHEPVRNREARSPESNLA